MNAYPLPGGDRDQRFNTALVEDITQILAKHGYPETAGTDRLDLGKALHAFLYGPDFNAGDKVTWLDGGKIWDGQIEAVVNAADGQVARIKTHPQPGGQYYSTSVVPCSDLTLVPAGA